MADATWVSRVSQAGISVAVEADADRLHVSQAGISVAVEADADRLRVSQAGISVAVEADADRLRVSQAGISVATCSVHPLGPVPGDLAALRLETGVVLSWTPSATATGYRLERSADGGTTWFTIAEIGGTTGDYADPGVSPAEIDYRLTQLEGLCEYVAGTVTAEPLEPPEDKCYEQCRFRVRFRDSAGRHIGELGYAHAEEDGRGGIEWLRYYKHIHGAGFCEFQITGNLDFLSEFDENGQVEVWMQVGALPWEIDFISINVNDYERSWPDGVERFHYRGPGERDVLARANVNYPAGVANRTAFIAQPAETVMTTLVRYNATGDALTTDGRLVDFATPFTVELAPDQGRGNVVDWYCFQQNLLESLGKLARVGGGDFSFERDPAGTGDYLRWRFGFAPGQLGADKSATLRFSLALGNLTNPRVRNAALGAPTVATVGGAGETTDREFTVTLADSYAAPARHRETFLNASDVATDAGRQSRAQAYLDQNRAREVFTWQALQTRDSRYKKDYKLGDLVTVVRPDTGAASVHKIVGVGVTLPVNGLVDIQLDTEQQP